MTNEQLDAIIQEAKISKAGIVPYDTGNLRENAIRIERLGVGMWRVLINEEIAPYAKYTNENWNEFDSPLKGKQNPNEGWWQKYFDDFLQSLVLLTGGKLNG